MLINLAQLGELRPNIVNTVILITAMSKTNTARGSGECSSAPVGPGGPRPPDGFW